MKRGCCLRHLFILGVAAFAATLPPAAAQEKRGTTYEAGQFKFNFSVAAGIGTFTATNTNFGQGTSSVDANGERKGTRRWVEGFLKPGLGVEYDLDSAGTLYGLFSLIAATTRGDGDAQDPSTTAGRPARILPEDVALGWKSSALFPTLGNDAIDFSVGSQTFNVGDGFVIGDGTVNSSQRGATVLGPRTALDQTVILKLNTQPVRADFFHLREHVDQTLMRGNDDPHTRLIGGNVEWFASREGDRGRIEYEQRLWSVGLMALKVLDADSARTAHFSFNGGSSGKAGNAGRNGLEVYAVRAGGPIVPFLEGFELYGEYGLQRNRDAGRRADARAWYVEPQYTLVGVPWKPRLVYRYAHFSGDANPTDRTGNAWDPLFPKSGLRGFGLWNQGEIYGRYSGLGNSNLNAQQVYLRVTPSEDVVQAGVLFYRLDFDQPRQTAGVTATGILDEVDIFVDWTTPLSGLKITPLIGAARPREGLKQQLGMASQDSRTLWLGQVVATYGF